MASLRALIFPGILLITAGCAAQGSISDSPFVKRDGSTIEVRLNGTPTEALRPFDIKDSQNVTVETVTHQASVSGPICWRVSGLHPGLGSFVQVGLTIREIRNDRPYTRWRDFRAVPDPVDDGRGRKAWRAGGEYCPREYILTERLRFKTLPPGEYVIGVRYHGQQNWDVQHILLEVAPG